MKKATPFVITLLVSFLFLNTMVFPPDVVQATACGFISNVEVDSWSVGGDYNGWGKMVRVNNSEYYLYSSINTSSKWYMGTIQIYNSNGTIGDIINTFDKSSCFFMGGDMVHWDGTDIYLTVGCDTGNVVRVHSRRVWDNNGTIEALGYTELTKSMDIWIDATHANNFELASMIVLDNGVIVVAFTDRTESNHLYLTSLIVSSDGTLSAETDLITVNDTGWYPQVIALDSNTIAVMYSDTDDDGWLKTYNVDSDGDIGDADDHEQDSWEFEPTYCEDHSFTIKNVYGATYILSYNDGSNFVAKTIRISNSGTITKSFVDSLTVSTAGNTPEFFRVNKDIMGIAYCGAANDGFIRTFNITETGYFDDLIIDYFEYWADVTVMNYPSVVYINDTYYHIFCEKFAVNELYKTIYGFTYEVECATGDIEEIGTLYINVYDETDMTPIDFNISFFASDWGDSNSEVYCPTTCSCPCSNCLDSWNISFADITPRGDGCYMIISNGSYHDRYFRMDIYDEFIIFQGETYYTLCLDIPLAPETARMYNLKAVDDYYLPLSDVEIQIKKYVDATIGVVDISTLRTDSYGTAQVYLISLYPYIFNCSKSGYTSVNFIWIPPDSDNVTKTIKMSSNVSEIEYPNETMYHECITFDGYVSGTTLYVNFSDSCTETVDTSIKVYEINGSTGTMTAFGWDNRTSSNSFQASFTGVNTSNCYKVVLYLNHSYFGSFVDSFIWCSITTITTKSVFDTLFNLNYGTSPGGFGWSNILGFIILVSGMFAFGQDGSGIAMIVTGGLLLFVNSYIGLTVISVLATSLLIVFGILVIWSNQRRKTIG